MNEEKKIKQAIIKSAEAVKRKVRHLRNMQMDNDNALETVFKPITAPLYQLANQNSRNSDEMHVSPKREDEVKKLKENTSFDTNDLTLHSYFPKKIETETESMESDQSNDDDNEINENSKDIYTDVSSSSKNEILCDASACASSTGLNQKYSTPVSHSPKEFASVPFGVRLERGKLMMGSLRIDMSDDKFKVGSNVYKKTPGLNELLYKKIPNFQAITDEDKHNYKLILEETNAHRRDYNPNKPIKSNKGLKYLHIIKPLFKNTETVNVRSQSTESHPIGRGITLPLKKRVMPRVDYVYWDDPNELVERLKLLIASREAGNTGLENEIISIIEELRENGTIS